MRLALLFSGQGGQRPEHGQQIGADLRQALADAAIDIAAVDPEKLAKNSIAQPFIFAQQMTLWSRLQAELPRPICAAGYSLGEMAACSAAGAFSAVEGLHLCIERARLMDQAAPDDSGMLAVLGLDEALVANRRRIRSGHRHPQCAPALRHRRPARRHRRRCATP
jgi:[acyl-carrier-protein] S-malonyltransferase